jgi:hypothetical protein
MTEMDVTWPLGSSLGSSSLWDQLDPINGASHLRQYIAHDTTLRIDGNVR